MRKLFDKEAFEKQINQDFDPQPEKDASTYRKQSIIAVVIIVVIVLVIILKGMKF